jgi:putative flippase GtrA
MSLGQYIRFVAVGAFVGIVTVAARELIGHLLPADSVLYYSLSVVIAYALGIVLSYVINQQFTFTNRGPGASSVSFLLFVVVALIGALSTWLLALLFRYGAHLGVLLGDWTAAVAFALAAVVSTLITYPLNARFVFRTSR